MEDFILEPMHEEILDRLSDTLLNLMSNRQVLEDIAVGNSRIVLESKFVEILPQLNKWFEIAGIKSDEIASFYEKIKNIKSLRGIVKPFKDLLFKGKQLSNARRKFRELYRSKVVIDNISVDTRHSSKIRNFIRPAQTESEIKSKIDEYTNMDSDAFDSMIEYYMDKQFKEWMISGRRGIKRIAPISEYSQTVNRFPKMYGRKIKKFSDYVIF